MIVFSGLTHHWSPTSAMAPPAADPYSCVKCLRLPLLCRSSSQHTALTTGLSQQSFAVLHPTKSVVISGKRKPRRKAPPPPGKNLGRCKESMSITTNQENPGQWDMSKFVWILFLPPKLLSSNVLQPIHWWVHILPKLKEKPTRCIKVKFDWSLAGETWSVISS